MDKFAQHIDKLIQKDLNEAAEEKATEVSEKLHGGQKNLDKNKNNKIDAEDFKLLRKKKDMKEQPNEGSYVMGSDGKPRGMKPGEKFSAFSPEDFEVPKFGTKEFNDLASKYFGGNPSNSSDKKYEDELEVDFDKFDPRDKSWEEITAHTGDDEFGGVDEDIKESLILQKNKIMEMMNRMKVIK